MAYGSIKVDNIIFTNGGADETTTVSGIYKAITSGVTVSGTISGTTIQGQTISGVTVTGTTIQGASGTFTSLTGVTTTGTTANFVTHNGASGVFTTLLSGATVTGTTAQFTNITGGGIGATTITGTTVTGTTANFVSGVFTTQISGATVTGTTANFTSGNFTALSGASTTVTSGIFAIGSAAAPSISFASDPNTGIYSPGADQVAISTNGTSRLAVSTTAVSSTLAVDVPLGAAATPSITFTGDLNTGIYSPAADTLAFSEGGAEAMRIDSSGRVGIGTSSPNSVLQVNSGTNLGGVLIGFNAGSSNFYDADLQIFRTGNGTERVRIDSSGNLGLGVAPNTWGTNRRAIQIGGNSSSALSLGAAVSEIFYNGYFNTSNQLIATTTGQVGYHDFNNNVAGGFTWGTSNASVTAGNVATVTTRMTLLAGGNVGIGTTSPADVLDTAAGNYRGITIKCGTTAHRPTLSFFNTTDSLAAYIQATGSSLAFGTMATDYGSHSEKVRIDSSGRLLVGTSSSRDNLFNTSYSALFQVEGQATANAQASLTSTTAGINGANLILCHQRSGSVGGNTVVQSDDQLGILSFQGADGTEMVPAASIEAYVDGTPGANDMPGRLVFSTTADGASSPTERMRIQADGQIRVTNNNTNIVYVNTGANGTALCYFQTASAELGKIRINGAGVAYDTTSDYRLKENLEPIADATTRVQALKPWRFNFISHPEVTVDGFLAHEAQEVVPEAVGGTKDEEDADGNPIYQGIDQSKLVPLLTAALQEAIGEIESLKARVVALEAS